ncbi:Glutaredoxin 3 [Seminavis robusta]|uniref:Glutaredoxin 3 n=1 Tax=Seminavis robusta TaxID=568900 RepID=A0A9N8E9Q9_9STRA|nr:Glutaredoxin 3 [Seminavis robusta]|eukprot:Sro664_g183650.1 Glutaredoxin 3 (535) ;mRNA; f:27119-28723
MGRITIFALDECPHCQRAKGAFKERGIPYTEISLSSHPHRRTDMLALSDRLTVPQIFLNEKHIGGADDTLELLKEWDNNCNGDPTSVTDDNETSLTPLQRYTATIASQPDPSDERLRISTEPPVVVKPPPPRLESDKIELPNGTFMSVLEVTEKLKQCLPHDDMPYLMKIYTNCFTGAAAVKAMTKSFDDCSVEKAVAFGKRLQERQMLHHVVYDHDFEDTGDYYFRLQCHQQPDILNSYRIWTQPADEDVVALITRLKKLLGKVESSVTNSQGLVDYKAACNHELFPVFEEAFCELQTVDLSKLDRTTKVAFAINLYNVAIKFAFMKVGIGSSSMSRSAFFTTIKFNVGGHLYSFQDLENGILRGNARAPYALSTPISKSDPRHAFVLKPEDVDCRIHFALNCGATSCPPVKSFTAEGIEEELRIVAEAFCEDDSNVRVDTIHRKIYLNKILSWYMVDFASSEEELPHKVVEFLRGSKKIQLQNMLMVESSKGVSVKFMNYDWSTNACDALAFDAGNLKPDYYSVNAAAKAIW